MAGDLPALALAKIVDVCLADGSILQLAALAGVCGSWRAAARDAGAHLVLESPASRTRRAHEPLALRFRAAPPARQAACFAALARLPAGRHAGFTGVGEAVTDAAVVQLAQPSVEAVVLKGSSGVTDAGLEAVARRCPRLRHLHLESLPAVRGTFLASLLARCRGLESLRVHDLPALQWPALPPAAPLLRLRALSLRGCLPPAACAPLFARLPGLASLSLGSHPPAVWAAAKLCPLLAEVSLLVGPDEATDGCLAALLTARALRALELCCAGAGLTAAQLRLAGMLDLRELRLESHAFRARPQGRKEDGHVDNAGVRALVDAVCARCMFQPGWRPFTLSLCGAAGLTHDAVASLLRLPLLSGLLLEGCHRISSLDRMRLVAKVKAGRGLLGAARSCPPPAGALAA